jgi:peptidoglycan/LPS O-acetylase OafA/YrhL
LTTSAGERFPRVDAVRALAALSIVVFHGLFQVGAALGDDSAVHAVRRLVAHTDVGVSVFFVLSGFLLYRPFVAARLAGRPAPRTGAYAWRRFLRIAPAYWVALTVLAVVLTYREVGDQPWVFYGFLQTCFPEHALQGIGQAWTLSTEVAFYVLLPVWAAALRRRGGGARTEWAALAALFAFGVAWQVYALAAQTDAAQFGHAAAPWLMTLPGYADQFAVGMALAVASVAVPARLDRLARWGWPLAVLAYLVLSYALENAAAGELPTDPQYLARHQLYGLVGLGVLLPAIAGGRRVPVRVLTWRPLALVGVVSYGLYLWHVGVMAWLVRRWAVPHDGLGHAAWFAAALAISLGIAALSWVLVERPALRLKRAFPRRPRGASEPHEPARARP